MNRVGESSKLKTEKSSTHRKLRRASAVFIAIATLNMGGSVEREGFEDFDHSFENGVCYQSIEFNRDGIAETGEVEYDEIINVQPVTDEEAYEKIRKELSDEEMCVAISSENDKELVEYFILNQDADPKNGVIICNMGWGADLRDVVARREAEVTAKSNPDKQIMVINNAGSGNSSLIPESIMKEMKETGSFISYGEWIYSLLEPELEKYSDNIEIRGHSLGARVAIGVAAAYFANTQNQIKTLNLIDPAGSDDRGFIGVAWGFVVSEGLKLKQYSKESKYNELSQLSDDNIDVSDKNNFKQNYIDLPVVMGKAELEDDLEKVLTAVSETLKIVSPEYSGLNDSETIKSILGRLALSENRPEHILQILLPEDSHAIISAGVGARVIETVDQIGMNDDNNS
ncbi:MAG: hypothetical protein LBM09_03105 [Candidatus Nomurabacteria bacterium]|jgi:pimeloyl-ACP methyl ester carboxylesterase|nr:hypothetical protein [Candidatus Nomurabacteria bacterium]